MAATLVAYSDSGSDLESDEDDLRTKKRPRVEERSTSAAWTRTFPHVDGNWPSYVSFQVHPTKLMRKMAEYAMHQAQARAGLTDLQLVPMESPSTENSDRNDQANAESMFHLSLSRTFVLTRAQIDPFVAALRLALRYRKRLRVSVQGLRVLINDERTRLFATVPVVSGAADVCHVIRCVDKCLAQFHREVYYADPLPHISVGSSTCILPALTSFDQEETSSLPPPVPLDLHQVHVTIGNKHFTIPLK